MSPVITVLIADDQDLVREGLRMLLEAEPGITVAGEAGTGSEAIEAARKLDPDVVLMDVRMPGLDGIEAVIPRDVAARRFHLYPRRIGDLVVLGDRGTVFGELPPGQESERLPDGYRSHGSLHERQVPLIVYNSEYPYDDPPAANKDLLTPLRATL